MRKRIQQMLEQEDMEMRNLGLCMLITQYDPEEWPSIISTSYLGYGYNNVDTVYHAKEYTLVNYRGRITVRLIKTTDLIKESYENHPVYSYKIVEL